MTRAWFRQSVELASLSIHRKWSCGLVKIDHISSSEGIRVLWRFRNYHRFKKRLPP